MANAGTSSDGEKRGFSIREEVKLAIDIAIDKFRSNEEQELEFPSSFTSSERAYVHSYCLSLGLSTKSKGKGVTKYVTIYKTSPKDNFIQAMVALPKESLDSLAEFVKAQSTAKDKQELAQNRVHRTNSNEGSKFWGKDIKNVVSSPPPVPTKTRSVSLRKTRELLSIFKMQTDIVEVVHRNQVSLIAAETGSGKSTQVGQFIMEHCSDTGHGCRIVQVVPNWWMTISLAEKVAAERGEHVGQSVGYNLRLESRISPKSSLVFGTLDVLLRILAKGHKLLKNLTHIIIDDFTEVDKYLHFLFICLFDLLKSCTNLRVIFLSDSLITRVLQPYFGVVPFLFVATKNYPVEVLFLEDVLSSKSMNKSVRVASRENDTNSSSFDHRKNPSPKQKAANDVACDRNDSPKVEMQGRESEGAGDVKQDEKKIGSIENRGSNSSDSQGQENVVIDCMQDSENVPQASSRACSKPEQKVYKELNTALMKAFKDGIDCFNQILQLVLNRGANVNHRHTHTGMTALMVASARGRLDVVRQLVELGADVRIKDCIQNMDALELAKLHKQQAVINYLQSYCCALPGTVDYARAGQKSANEAHQKGDGLGSNSDDDYIDFAMITSVLTYICKNKGEGTVVIFLPSYDEISSLRDRLLEDVEFSKKNRYHIIVLHSLSVTGTLRKVFKVSNPNVRKIVLTTSISETAVPFDDVAFVIDTGRCRRRVYSSGSLLSTARRSWICKTSVFRRGAIAGRCPSGVCFHLFTRAQYLKLRPFQDPELFQSSFQDICLLARILAPVNMSISDFLGKGPMPSQGPLIKSSVQALQRQEALDDTEELTDLGKIITELPLEPYLAKMVVFGLMMKCLDPVLIIACAIMVKDVFVVPTSASQRRAVMSSKYKFAAKSQSDHIAVLRAYQAWSRAREEGRERLFCHQNSLSLFAMESISSLRTQVINHLRSLGYVKPRGPGDMKDLNANSNRWFVIKAALCGGLYPRLMQVDKQNKTISSEKESGITFHHSSVLCTLSSRNASATDSKEFGYEGLSSNWIVYEDLTPFQGTTQARNLTVVPALAVALTAGLSLFQDHSTGLSSSKDSDRKRYLEDGSDSENESDANKEVDENLSCLKVDEWISFRADHQTIGLLWAIRSKLITLLKHRIQIPLKLGLAADDAILKRIVNLLMNEDQSHGHITMKGDKVEAPPLEQNYVHSGGQREVMGGAKTVDAHGRKRYGRHEEEGRRESTQDKSSLPVSKEMSFSRQSSSTGQGRLSPRKDQQVGGKRFFIMKCNNERNLEISFSRSIWATTKGNERKLDHAFHTSSEVILFFSIQGSGHFQGFAQMVSEVSNKTCRDFGSDSLGGVFSVEWLQKRDIAFQHTHHLTNPWNENKKVQVSRDGQELEPSVGEKLCQLWHFAAGTITLDRDHAAGSYVQLGEGASYQGGSAAGDGYNGQYDKENVKDAIYDGESIPAFAVEPECEQRTPSEEFVANAYDPHSVAGAGAQPMIFQPIVRGNRHEASAFQQVPHMEDSYYPNENYCKEYSGDYQTGFYEPKESSKGLIYVGEPSGTAFYPTEPQEPVYNAGYGNDYRPLPPQQAFAHPGVYPPLVSPFHPQAPIHTTFRSQEIYHYGPGGQYGHFNRPMPPEFFSPGMPMYPSSRMHAGRHTMIGRTRPINIKGGKQ